MYININSLNYTINHQRQILFWREVSTGQESHSLVSQLNKSGHDMHAFDPFAV